MWCEVFGGLWIDQPLLNGEQQDFVGEVEFRALGEGVPGEHQGGGGELFSHRQELLKGDDSCLKLLKVDRHATTSQSTVCADEAAAAALRASRALMKATASAAHSSGLLRRLKVGSVD